MDSARYHEGSTFRLTMAGRFTFADHVPFRSVLEEIIKPEVEQVQFDVDALEFIDSAAMGMLLLALEEAEKHHKSITIKGAQGQVKKMLHVARFDSLFTIEA
jgi:anti-anti-sigma factor